MRRLLLLIALAVPAFAQFTTTASHIRPVAALPATCKPGTGDVVFLTTPTIGTYQCLTTNIWTAMGGGGGGSSVNFSTVAFSATPTFTVAASTAIQIFKMTLTGNVTSSTLSLASATTGQYVTFILCQDGSGGHTFSWPSNVTGFSTIGSTLSTCSQQDFVYDGTNAVATTPLYVTGAAGGSITTPDISTPSNPPASTTISYSKAGSWCSLSPAGIEACTQAVGAGAARPYLNFQGTLGNVSGNGTIYTYTLPANTMGANGCVSVVSNIKDVALGTGTVVINFSFGGTATAFLSAPAAGHNVVSKFILCNTGVTNAQSVIVEGAGFDNNGGSTTVPIGFGGAILTTYAVDTTASAVIALTVSGVSGGTQTTTPVWFLVY